MPRNPNKTRCQVPGCRNWAMRGHTRCRSHRDRELGSRGGGAPRGNLNALKTGRHTRPIPLPALNLLAGQIVRQPEQLPEHIAGILRSIQARTPDPHKTLLAFQAALPKLTSLVAKDLFIVEAEALLRQTPPSQRGSLFRAIKRLAHRREPGAVLRDFRSLVIELEKSQTQAGTASDHNCPAQRQDLAEFDN